MGDAPRMDDVLANVVRGRVAYVCLTPEQKRAFRDFEGRIALDVLRHLLGARPTTPQRFPLTEQAFQAISHRLGYVVGQKRCRRMVERLLAAGVIGLCGQYRQPYRNSAVRSGYRVRLFKLGRVLRASRLAKRKRPVGRQPSVKTNFRTRWWQHPLFGDLLGLPPPEIPRRALQRMKSLDEVFQSPAMSAAQDGRKSWLPFSRQASRNWALGWSMTERDCSRGWASRRR